MAIAEFSNVFVPVEPSIAITAHGSVAATWTYEPIDRSNTGVTARECAGANVLMSPNGRQPLVC